MSRALRCCALRRQKRDLSSGGKRHGAAFTAGAAFWRSELDSACSPVTVVVGRLICFCSELGVTSQARKSCSFICG